MCIQRQQLGLVPFLIPTIDFVRLIKQNDLTADYLDGYLRAVYGPSSRRYLFLKQAYWSGDWYCSSTAWTRCPPGSSRRSRRTSCASSARARASMTSRPGGFSQAWLSQCTTMRILPLDPTMQESVAKARLRHGAHLRMFSSLMGRPDLQLLASNPLILSMVLAYIRGAAHNSTDGGTPTLNRWRLYHSAMSTIITRLDAKTLEALRKGQGRNAAEYMRMLLELVARPLTSYRYMRSLRSRRTASR